jgi:hypothetical protein
LEAGEKQTGVDAKKHPSKPQSRKDMTNSLRKFSEDLNSVSPNKEPPAKAKLCLKNTGTVFVPTKKPFVPSGLQLPGEMPAPAKATKPKLKLRKHTADYTPASVANNATLSATSKAFPKPKPHQAPTLRLGRTVNTLDQCYSIVEQIFKPENYNHQGYTA